MGPPWAYPYVSVRIPAILPLSYTSSVPSPSLVTFRPCILYCISALCLKSAHSIIECCFGHRTLQTACKLPQSPFAPCKSLRPPFVWREGNESPPHYILSFSFLLLSCLLISCLSFPCYPQLFCSSSAKIRLMPCVNLKTAALFHLCSTLPSKPAISWQFHSTCQSIPAKSVCSISLICNALTMPKC